ncbi:hypothetical protein HDU96_004455 [Phlyctochytrium bullatum]|nr:hypothetical protein HDU96_004455 [Phlyctochytrium bullatum]
MEYKAAQERGNERLKNNLESINSNPESNEELEIHQFDVDQGDCALIVVRGESTIKWAALIDSGDPGALRNKGSLEKIKTILGIPGKSNETNEDSANKAATGKRLDAIFITHWDKDHFGGLKDLFSETPPVWDNTTVLYAPPFLDDPDFVCTAKWCDNADNGAFLWNWNIESGTDRYKFTKAYLERTGKNFRVPLVGEAFGPENCSKFSMTCIMSDGWVLTGTADDYKVARTSKELKGKNGSSLGFLITFEDFRFVTCGDAIADQEQHLSNLDLVKKVDLFKLSHHGSATSTVTQHEQHTTKSSLLMHLEPTLMMITNGVKTSHGIPNLEVLDATLGSLSSNKFEKPFFVVFSNSPIVASLKHEDGTEEVKGKKNVRIGRRKALVNLKNQMKEDIFTEASVKIKLKHADEQGEYQNFALEYNKGLFCGVTLRKKETEPGLQEKCSNPYWPMYVVAGVHVNNANLSYVLNPNSNSNMQEANMEAWRTEVKGKSSESDMKTALARGLAGVKISAELKLFLKDFDQDIMPGDIQITVHRDGKTSASFWRNNFARPSRIQLREHLKFADICKSWKKVSDEDGNVVLDSVGNLNLFGQFVIALVSGTGSQANAFLTYRAKKPSGNSSPKPENEIDTTPSNVIPKPEPGTDIFLRYTIQKTDYKLCKQILMSRLNIDLITEYKYCGGDEENGEYYAPVRHATFLAEFKVEENEEKKEESDQERRGEKAPSSPQQDNSKSNTGDDAQALEGGHETNSSGSSIERYQATPERDGLTRSYKYFYIQMDRDVKFLAESTPRKKIPNNNDFKEDGLDKVLTSLIKSIVKSDDQEQSFSSDKSWNESIKGFLVWFIHKINFSKLSSITAILRKSGGETKEGEKNEDIPFSLESVTVGIKAKFKNYNEKWPLQWMNGLEVQVKLEFSITPFKLKSIVIEVIGGRVGVQDLFSDDYNLPGDFERTKQPKEESDSQGFSFRTLKLSVDLNSSRYLLTFEALIPFSWKIPGCEQELKGKTIHGTFTLMKTNQDGNVSSNANEDVPKTRLVVDSIKLSALVAFGLNAEGFLKIQFERGTGWLFELKFYQLATSSVQLIKSKWSKDLFVSGDVQNFDFSLRKTHIFFARNTDTQDFDFGIDAVIDFKLRSEALALNVQGDLRFAISREAKEYQILFEGAAEIGWGEVKVSGNCVVWKSGEAWKVELEDLAFDKCNKFKLLSWETETKTAGFKVKRLTYTRSNEGTWNANLEVSIQSAVLKIEAREEEFKATVTNPMSIFKTFFSGAGIPDSVTLTTLDLTLRKSEWTAAFDLIINENEGDKWHVPELLKKLLSDVNIRFKLKFSNENSDINGDTSIGLELKMPEKVTFDVMGLSVSVKTLSLAYTGSLTCKFSGDLGQNAVRADAMLGLTYREGKWTFFVSIKFQEKHSSVGIWLLPLLFMKPVDGDEFNTKTFKGEHDWIYDFKQVVDDIVVVKPPENADEAQKNQISLGYNMPEFNLHARILLLKKDGEDYIFDGNFKCTLSKTKIDLNIEFKRVDLLFIELISAKNDKDGPSAKCLLDAKTLCMSLKFDCRVRLLGIVASAYIDFLLSLREIRFIMWFKLDLLSIFRAEVDLRLKWEQMDFFYASAKFKIQISFNVDGVTLLGLGLDASVEIGYKHRDRKNDDESVIMDCNEKDSRAGMHIRLRAKGSVKFLSWEVNLDLGPYMIPIEGNGSSQQAINDACDNIKQQMGKAQEKLTQKPGDESQKTLKLTEHDPKKPLKCNCDECAMLICKEKAEGQADGDEKKDGRGTEAKVISFKDTTIGRIERTVKGCCQMKSWLKQLIGVDKPEWKVLNGSVNYQDLNGEYIDRIAEIEQEATFTFEKVLAKDEDKQQSVAKNIPNCKRWRLWRQLVKEGKARLAQIPRSNNVASNVDGRQTVCVGIHIKKSDLPALFQSFDFVTVMKGLGIVENQNRIVVEATDKEVEENLLLVHSPDNPPPPPDDKPPPVPERPPQLDVSEIDMDDGILARTPRPVEEGKIFEFWPRVLCAEVPFSSFSNRRSTPRTLNLGDDLNKVVDWSLPAIYQKTGKEEYLKLFMMDYLQGQMLQYGPLANDVVPAVRVAVCRANGPVVELDVMTGKELSVLYNEPVVAATACFLDSTSLIVAYKRFFSEYRITYNGGHSQKQLFAAHGGQEIIGISSAMFAAIPGKLRLHFAIAYESGFFWVRFTEARDRVCRVAFSRLAKSKVVAVKPLILRSRDGSKDETNLPMNEGDNGIAIRIQRWTPSAKWTNCQVSGLPDSRGDQGTTEPTALETSGDRMMLGHRNGMVSVWTLVHAPDSSDGFLALKESEFPAHAFAVTTIAAIRIADKDVLVTADKESMRVWSKSTQSSFYTEFLHMDLGPGKQIVDAVLYPDSVSC